MLNGLRNSHEFFAVGPLCLAKKVRVELVKKAVMRATRSIKRYPKNFAVELIKTTPTLANSPVSVYGMNRMMVYRQACFIVESRIRDERIATAFRERRRR
jgi:hypothetical protein